MFTNIEFLCNFHKFISAQQAQSLALFRISSQTALFRAGSVQIQDLAKGGQLLRLKVANIAKQSNMSRVSHLWLGSRDCLIALFTKPPASWFMAIPLVYLV